MKPEAQRLKPRKEVAVSPIIILNNIILSHLLLKRFFKRPYCLIKGSIAMLFLTRQLVESILSFSKEKHPDEMLLLLRGKKKGNDILLYQAVFPQFAYSNWHSATYNPLHLPIDFTILATAHSHPSGVKLPSQVDLLHPYGKFMLISGFPYENADDIAAFDARGNIVQWGIVDEQP